MLVSSRPTPLVTTMLDLIDSASANDLHPLRIGVASGSAVSRAGDWFGNPVDLASRVSAAARPGAVLVGLHAGDRRRRRRPPVVVRRRISSEGRQQQGHPVSGAARPGGRVRTPFEASSPGIRLVNSHHRLDTRTAPPLPRSPVTNLAVEFDLKRPSNDLLHNLVRPTVDLLNASIGPHPADGILGHIAVAAV